MELTFTQLSRETGFSTAYFRAKVKSGELKAEQRGKLYYVSREAWEEFRAKNIRKVE